MCSSKLIHPKVVNPCCCVFNPCVSRSTSIIVIIVACRQFVNVTSKCPIVVCLISCAFLMGVPLYRHSDCFTFFFILRLAAMRVASETIPATAWRAATVTRHHTVSAWGHLPHCFPGHMGQPGSIPVPQFAPGHFCVLSTCHYGILQRTRPLCATCHARPPCACLRNHHTKTTTLLIFFTRHQGFD